jgi:hypothetical protein
MKIPNRQNCDEDFEAVSPDLARRLERYRTRVEAEGRKRSLEVIDRAIRDANESPATNP